MIRKCYDLSRDLYYSRMRFGFIISKNDIPSYYEFDQKFYKYYYRERFKYHRDNDLPSAFQVKNRFYIYKKCKRHGKYVYVDDYHYRYMGYTEFWRDRKNFKFIGGIDWFAFTCSIKHSNDSFTFL